MMLMIRLMGGTSGGQNYWELVDVSTGEVLLRSWDKEDVVRLYEKRVGHHEASRVQKLLIEQNAQIDRIKASNKKLEAENKKLKNAMFGIIGLCKYGAQRMPSLCSEPEGYCTCVKAFDALDYDLSNMYQIDYD